MSMHESFLSKDVVPTDDDLDLGGRHPALTNIIAAWWSQVTTSKERSEWAVLDMHHYHAWEPQCQGSNARDNNDGNFTCPDVAARRDALQRCSSWATETFRKLVHHHCHQGDDESQPLLMSGEFSTATHYRIRHACQDISTLKDSYMYQLKAAEEANVNLFYWSYKMPYGGTAKY
eukprot:CAMPEP_0178919536 /NCGR_PEP_ID=MMETSP0786-20121207/14491_1 /TAXON_ID=186022 /ORGANISM="Thalassionema frauenfeldii, Strain CCMP 1798" /LENGTH=174 /DNA_ID=CAMNT_0020593477 /DNA_START=16 /DNA_END=537 /DNA_ORIENTATION=+